VPTLRILLVDDHEVVRLGLKALLGRHSEFEVVGEAANADEALRRTLALNPDVVVMDIRLPGENGIQATRAIVAERPQTKVIMLTSYAEDELLMEAIEAGAAGYVLKQIGSSDLIRALQAVARGESLLDPSLTGRVFQRLRQAAREERGSAFRDLTEQEVKILRLVAEGLTNKEIGARMFLAEKTVRNYVSAILGKLGLASRAQAAAFAVQHGLNQMDEPRP
jgi:two-component system, NarL family, response regulator DevR